MTCLMDLDTAGVVEKLVHRIRAASLGIQNRAVTASRQHQVAGTSNFQRRACGPAQQIVIVSRQDCKEPAAHDVRCCLSPCVQGTLLAEVGSWFWSESVP